MSIKSAKVEILEEMKTGKSLLEAKLTVMHRLNDVLDIACDEIKEDLKPV